MTAKTITIKSVSRRSKSGEDDALNLDPGVNVIVGLKDTGKTSWLQTISFLLGDTDQPENAMGEAIATKFISANLEIQIEDEQITLERRWTERGARTKIFANGEVVPAADFSQWLYLRLGIPALRFPKGNPFSGSTWPDLSWRMLFRHVFREERFWSDLADKQPEKEQHACILQFLGAADKIFPKELGEEIDQRKDLLKLQARKEQFDDVLQEATSDLVRGTSVSSVPTLDSINEGIATLRNEIQEFQRRREALLAAISSKVEVENLGGGLPRDTRLGEQRVGLAISREKTAKELAELDHRIAELAEHRALVTDELNRLTRVEVASDLFKPLTVTCCPNCDQKVNQRSAPAGHCFVCQQQLPTETGGGWLGAKKRLAFEEEQLRGEDAELAELVTKLQHERDRLGRNLRRCDEDLAEVDVLLRPVRSAVAAMMPPEIGTLDTQIGQREERIAQLTRLREVVAQRDALTRQIDALQSTIQELATHVEAKGEAIPFEQLSDAISDGINEYLDQLKAGDPERWKHQPIRFEIGEHTFRLKVGKKSWGSLGATSIGYVILGYHYALLKLSGGADYNYPGICLIDFPMTLADKTTIGDKENYLVEPFVALAAANPAVQVVICGRAFRALKGVKRIPLRKVWSQGGIELEPGDGASVDDGGVPEGADHGSDDSPTESDDDGPGG